MLMLFIFSFSFTSNISSTCVLRAGFDILWWLFVETNCWKFSFFLLGFALDKYVSGWLGIVGYLWKLASHKKSNGNTTTVSTTESRGHAVTIKRDEWNTWCEWNSNEIQTDERKTFRFIQKFCSLVFIFLLRAPFFFLRVFFSFISADQNGKGEDSY